jgi:hypothetical protein
MGYLVFKANDARRVAQHSINSKLQGTTFVDYDKRGKPITKDLAAPCVMLVHDDGVYLMSNGEPRDIVGGTSSFCAHAIGCNPKTDPGWPGTSRALVGGDNFGETLPWAKQIKELLDAGAKEIVIEIGGNSIELLKKPPKKWKT